MRILEIQETCGGLGAQCPTVMENNVANMLYAIQRKKADLHKKGQLSVLERGRHIADAKPSLKKALFLGGEDDKFTPLAEIVSTGCIPKIHKHETIVAFSFRRARRGDVVVSSRGIKRPSRGIHRS